MLQRRNVNARQEGPNVAFARSPSKQRATVISNGGIRLSTALSILLGSKLLSAYWNPVHDCDEVYNYWEPLHFLMYGSGMQTWEYSAEFALRSYWYLLLHAPAAIMASVLTKSLAGKHLVFYGVKAFLALVSALVELRLYRAVRDAVGNRTANLLLLFLTFSTGMFVSSTSLLPSSFAMYMVAGAASSVLEGQSGRTILFAVACVTWGWPVAGIALVPFAAWILIKPSLIRSFAILAASLSIALSLQIAADRIFYGRWTNSLWNFVKYNVVGGGDSSLYGVESATYYFRNGILNLNVLLPLALLAPIMAAVLRSPRSAPSGTWRLMVAVLPVWLWLAALTLLPHKEERFLYVVYPLICLGAAVSLHALCILVYKSLAYFFHRKAARSIANLFLTITLGVFLVISAARSVALVRFYGAPMKIYNHLPKGSRLPDIDIPVCVGSEWHRFPSSFFLPDHRHKLQFVKSGFTGLLPRAFNLEEGGTAASSPYFNDRNKEVVENYWADQSQCKFLVELEEDITKAPGRSGWKRLQSHPFVMAHKSAVLLARTLYIPYYSDRHNKIGTYVLYGREESQQPSLMETLNSSRAMPGRPMHL